MTATPTLHPELDARQLKRFREFHAREVAAGWLYRELAQIAEDGDTAALLAQLAETEDRHAEHWEEILTTAGIEDLEVRVPVRDRMILVLAKRFGVDTVVPMLMKLEAGDAGMYIGVPEAHDDMASEEIELGEALASLGEGEVATIAVREGRHRANSGGWLRAATFGVNDGLVSNLALVMGIAGGTSDASLVLLAGIAGLIAGALSMAAGEWISVKSQAELFEREIEIEREELRYFPEEEKAELALIFQSKGISKAQAEKVAAQLLEDEDTALDTLAREELGLDPEELGSPWVAAIASFFAFAFGAVIPVIPFLVGTGTAAVVGAAIAAGLMLGVVGFAISLMTGRSGWFSALRMTAIGLGAAGATYLVGSLVGVAVS